MTQRDAVAEAAENIRAFLDDIQTEYAVTHPNAHTDWHSIKGDFALLRNAAELWAKEKDREEADHATAR